MNIEYDKSPNISHEQRVMSLANSTRRAFDEVEALMEELRTEVEKLREMVENQQV